MEPSDGENYENNHKPTDTNEIIFDVSTTNFCDVMDVPPSSSRQPPDGDEFPDHHENTILSTESKKETSVKAKPNWSHSLWNTRTSYHLFRDQQSSFSVRDKIAIFSNTPSSTSSNNLKKVAKSTDDIPTSIENEFLDKTPALRTPFNKIKRSLSTSCKSDSNRWVPEKLSAPNSLKYCTIAGNKTRSSLDLSLQTSHTRCLSEETFNYTDSSYTLPPRLHTRSQSLVDITTNDQKTDRWKLLAEQRQRSLSKLKGLVIPEQVIEVDVPTVDLPEIKNNNLLSVIDTKTVQVTPELPNYSCQRNSNVPVLSSPPWTSNVPKYSPAFKRKSLQIHSETVSSGTVTLPRTPTTLYEPDTLSNSKFYKQPSQIDLYNTSTKISNYTNDPPKSLESITSPTRSDYSFEYVQSSPDVKETKTQSQSNYRFSGVSQDKIEPKKLDDDSDNDSAVSSSQSSYMSRTPPPSSPSELRSNYNSSSTNTLEFLHNKDDESDSQINSECDNQSHRLLKPQSVEAINRKNILASARCRSGKHFKIGSPLIQRRFDEEENAPNLHVSTTANVPCSLSEENVKDTVVSTCLADVQPTSTVSKTVHTPEKEEEVELKVSVGQTNSINSNSLIGSNNMDKGIENRLTYINSLFKTRSTSVNDLRKSFEKLAPVPNFDVTNSELPKITRANSVPTKKNDQSSNESLNRRDVVTNGIVKKLQEFSVSNDTIVLQPEIPGGSVGITLAGGADYETKEITVHKIREDSSAHRDGRLQKGDVVLFINGKSVEGLTHRQLVKLLKEPLPEVTLVINKMKNLDQSTPTSTPTSPRTPSTPKSLELPLKKEIENSQENHKTIIVNLIKDTAGLGVSLEGGKDSPLGDMPLLIKKLFKGGAAEKTGKLQVGDEILFVNETEVSVMSRLEVWSILKKLPENITVSLTVRRSNMP